MRVLIVEPDPQLRGDLARTLRQTGFGADPSPSIPHAMELLRGGCYEAVLVDISSADTVEDLGRVVNLARGAPVLAMGASRSPALAVEASRREKSPSAVRKRTLQRREWVTSALLSAPIRCSSMYLPILSFE